MTVVNNTWIAPNLSNTVQATKARPMLQNPPAWASGGRSLDPWQRSGRVPTSQFLVEPAGGGRGLGSGPWQGAPPTNIPVPPQVAFVYTGTGIPRNGGATRMANKRL
jgi:hypothetical protein